MSRWLESRRTRGKWPDDREAEYRIRFTVVNRQGLQGISFHFYLMICNITVLRWFVSPSRSMHDAFQWFCVRNEMRPIRCCSGSLGRISFNQVFSILDRRPRPSHWMRAFGLTVWSTNQILICSQWACSLRVSLGSRCSRRPASSLERDRGSREGVPNTSIAKVVWVDRMAFKQLKIKIKM